MRRVFWLVAAALLLAGCTGEKGIVEKEGYQLDTRRQAQAAYPRIKVLVIDPWTTRIDAPAAFDADCCLLKFTKIFLGFNPCFEIAIRTAEIRVCLTDRSECSDAETLD